MISEQFREGYLFFIDGDFNYAYQKFNYLRNQVEYNYPQGLSGASCRRMYYSALYLKELCAIVAEAYCQYPFWIEAKEEVTVENMFTIFPNPANSALTITSTDAKTTNYQIISIDGKIVGQGSFNNNTTIHVEQFSRNIYMIIFSDENAKYLETQKVILQ
ncbi:MAG: T9SS type A sorting domain-containing protein [Chitinophagales bacterium]